MTSVVSATLVAGIALLLARFLGPSEFGTYTLVSVIAVSLSGLLIFSVNIAMLHQLPTAGAHETSALMGTALVSVAGACALLGGVTVVIAPSITTAWGVPADLVWRTLGLTVASGLNLLGDSFLRGRKMFAWAACLRLAASLGYAGIALVMLLVGHVRTGASFVEAFTLTTAIAGLIGCLLAGARPWGWTPHRARLIYGHGLPVTLASVLLGVLFTLDSVLLGHTGGPFAVGVYSVYNGMPKRLAGILMHDGIGLTLLPTLATADTRACLIELRRILPGLLACLSTGLAMVCLPLTLLSGAQYGSDPGLMLVSGFGIAVHCLVVLLGFILTMDGRRGALTNLHGVLIALLPAVAVMWVFLQPGTPTAAVTTFTLVNILLLGSLSLVTLRRYRRAPTAASGKD